MKGMRWSVSDDMSLAHHIADEATASALDWFGKPLGERAKPDGTLVTDADEAVEDQIRAILAAERPTDAVLGEERGQTGTSERRWIIDGIDGTVEFAAGTARWGILIALEIEGEIVLGICAQPALTRRYYATRTKGAFARVDGTSGLPQRLAVSRSSDLATAASFVPARQIRTDADRRVAELLARASTARPSTNHPALQVAEGNYEIAMFFHVGPWDIAAPSIVVEEAGGRFTDLVGNHDLETDVAVFSNGYVHDAALAALDTP